MNDLKYIIFRIGSPAMYYYKACVFNGMLTHSAIAEEHCKHKAFEAWSAGFCSISIVDGRLSVQCWGKSESLGIESSPGIDAQFILDTLTRV